MSVNSDSAWRGSLFFLEWIRDSQNRYLTTSSSSLDRVCAQQQTLTMATVLPPPSKRQRIETSEKARIQAEENQIPEGLGSVRVQFVDQSTGNGTGPAIAVSISNATVKNLETLLNSIQGNVGRRSSIGTFQG